MGAVGLADPDAAGLDPCGSPTREAPFGPWMRPARVEAGIYWGHMRHTVRGLVVGRFQPFHNGHQALIQGAIEDCVHVVVAIGSSNAKRSTRNPFSYEERERMVRAVFGDRVEVAPLPDIHDPPHWVEHVIDRLGAVDKVYGNDERTLALFEDEGIKVGRPGVVDRERLEGTTVRIQIAEGDRDWRRAVPEPVVRLLDEWDAAKRLRLLEATA